MGIFGSKSAWEEDLATRSGSIGHALGQVITGRMPADFLDDVMSVNVEQISQAYAAALNEGKEKKAAKIIWKRIEFPAEIACESAGISKSAAWNGSRALKDSILASCQAS